MMPGEVPVSKEDKEKILEHWKEITGILDKYETFNGCSDWATCMFRVKETASEFVFWVKLLDVINE